MGKAVSLLRLTNRPDGLHLALAPCELDLAATLDCGQAFRFRETAPGRFEGVAFGRFLRLVQTPDEIVFEGVSRAEYDEIWRGYFDLGADYAALKRALSEDDTLRDAIAYSPGIRLLRQESFETLVSFLISQNNNIPRIKGCIERLCRKFGAELAPGVYAFPTPERMAGAAPADYAELGLGYRDSYLLDCARRIADGRLDLGAVAQMPLGEAREALRAVLGVGPKVAECALLFGFYQTGAFPVDTWIKKALARFYPEGFPARFAPVAGIAQQYLFHYIRTCRAAG